MDGEPAVEIEAPTNESDVAVAAEEAAAAEVAAEAAIEIAEVEAAADVAEAQAEAAAAVMIAEAAAETKTEEQEQWREQSERHHQETLAALAALNSSILTLLERTPPMPEPEKSEQNTKAEPEEAKPAEEEAKADHPEGVEGESRAHATPERRRRSRV